MFGAQKVFNKGFLTGGLLGNINDDDKKYDDSNHLDKHLVACSTYHMAGPFYTLALTHLIEAQPEDWLQGLCN